MNVDKYRSSFELLMYVPSFAESAPVVKILQEVGYLINQVHGTEDLLKQLKENPPHILLIDFEYAKEMVEAIAVESAKISPETKIILLYRSEDQKIVVDYFGGVVKDLVLIPAVNPMLLQESVDRLVMLNLYQYQNEQLLDKLKLVQQNTEIKKTDKIRPDDKVNFFIEKVLGIFQKNSLIRLFLNEVNVEKALYFKYLPGYHSLALKEVKGFSFDEYRGVGAELKSVDEVSYAQVLQPQKLIPLLNLMKDVFNEETFFAKTISIENKIDGIFVFCGIDEAPFSEIELKQFNQQMMFIDLKEKYRQSNPLDESSQVLNRHHFLKSLTEEVSRARRTRLPVSCLIISVDEFEDQKNKTDLATIERLYKNIGSVLSKNSRVNDVIGRLGENEFSVLLPHTGLKGAKVKSERLRKIFETSDFSKLLPGKKQVTISVGVSEYPSVSADADELLQTADDALYQVRQQGPNMICLATPKSNFVPDFNV